MYRTLFYAIHPFRCVFITVDPAEGVKDENWEPLKTLRKWGLCSMFLPPLHSYSNWMVCILILECRYRLNKKEFKDSPMFGINLLTSRAGIIKVGDPVYASLKEWAVHWWKLLSWMCQPSLKCSSCSVWCSYLAGTIYHCAVTCMDDYYDYQRHWFLSFFLFWYLFTVSHAWCLFIEHFKSMRIMNSHPYFFILLRASFVWQGTSSAAHLMNCSSLPAFLSQMNERLSCFAKKMNSIWLQACCEYWLL